MKSGAVAFLDILGFKGIWRVKPEEEVLNLVMGVAEVVTRGYKHPPPEKRWPECSLPQVTTLSDTIVITMDSLDRSCVLLLANTLYGVMMHFQKHELFVRGAIGWGNYAQMGNTFLGPAIDDVAAWHEQANWIGVVSTPTTNYIIDRFSPFAMDINGFSVDQFVKYDVPGNGGATYRLNSFNWPGYLQASYKEMPVQGKSTARAAMEALFMNQHALDASVLKKYENTLRFVDYAVGFMRPVERKAHPA
ncbi:MAG: hypothetical protein A3F74_19535 [Betaproteobacteria bacterium RIFCSPLOWO2_12_FULL_62_58]|nr:MAG: hypothetical protein A3F74_19535 [Betaproteobacteria bacterium RIFCSPLOWO2_12_FULL_62_58]